MKKLRYAVLVVCFVTLSLSGNAQNTTQAHINVQQLLSEMPQMKSAQAELKKLEETYTANLQSAFEEFQNKAKQYESEAPSKTQEENERRAIELQNMERNLGDARQTASQELQKKQAEMYQPILEMANNAVTKVANQLGYLYVLDASPGSGVIVANGKDLMPEVKRELGF